MTAPLVYLDSSVALRTILDTPERDGTALLDRVSMLEITRETHRRRIHRPARQDLDAFHLATALLIGELVTMATHEQQ